MRSKGSARPRRLVVNDAGRAGSCSVDAGTAWLWARPEAFEGLNVLVVDEVAQMSLANVLAISQAASGTISMPYFTSFIPVLWDPSGYFHLNEVSMISDADSLVKALKESTYFHEGLAAGGITQTVADIANDGEFSQA